MKNGLYLAFLYLSSVIGAGFASGQELFSFFLSHGKKGFFAFFFAGALFALLGVRLFLRMGEEKTTSLSLFLEKRIGHFPSLLAEYLTQGFILSTFIVMIGAGSTLLYENYSMPRLFGAILTFLFCIFPLLFKEKGLLVMGTLLVPLMVFTVVFLSGSALYTFPRPLSFEVTDTSSPLYSALLFVSYNTLTLIPVTAPFSARMDKKSACIGGILTGGILLLLMLLSGSAISVYPASKMAEMPLLAVAERIGAGGIYFLLMFASIISTASTGAFSLIARFFPKKRRSAILFLGLLSVPLSLFGFSRLLTFFYPLFGFLGLLLFPVYCTK